MSTSQTAVDMKHLHQYTGDDLGLELEIFGLFRQQVQIWLKMLVASADSESWGAAAHSLKGSARGLGAHQLAAACEAAEVVVLSGLTERSLAAEKVRAEVDAVLHFIDRREYNFKIQDLRNSSQASNS